MVYGAASGEPTQLDAQQLIGQMRVVRGYTRCGELARLGGYSEELLGCFRAGQLLLPVLTYPIAEVPAAHRALKSRQAPGKVVLLF